MTKIKKPKKLAAHKKFRAMAEQFDKLYGELRDTDPKFAYNFEQRLYEQLKFSRKEKDK